MHMCERNHPVHACAWIWHSFTINDVMHAYNYYIRQHTYIVVQTVIVNGISTCIINFMGLDPQTHAQNNNIVMQLMHVDHCDN